MLVARGLRASIGRLGNNRPWMSPGGVVSTVLDFNSALVTFTQKMAKRVAPGPFGVAPLVQGEIDASALSGDVLSYPSGTVVKSSYFYSNLDLNQGSVVFWITPEWNGNDGYSHQLLWSYDQSWWGIHLRKSSSNNLVCAINGFSVSKSVSTWVAGNTYCVVLRWSCLNKLDGTNYGCVSVDDSHTFGHTGSWSPNNTTGPHYIGSRNTGLYSLGAVIEGLTFYRRPLFDGTYGIDVGNGDEIAAIYAAGAGKDPCEVTGSWDVVLCVPTAQVAGNLATNSLDAWSHPFTSNVLTDTWAQTTYASSGWTTLGTPSTGPADAATADKVYAWGYTWTSDADAEGIKQSKTSLTAGQNYVMRLVAHENAGSNMRVKVYDDTNGAAIVTFLFGSGSSRAAPGVAIITWELPTTARYGVGANCTAMTISVESTVAAQTITMHQCEVLVNVCDNPSMEGTWDATPARPGGWNGNEDTVRYVIEDGDVVEEAVIVHSGAKSMKFVAAAATDDAVSNPGIASGTVGNYYAVGAWIYGSGITSAGLGHIYQVRVAKQSVVPGSYTIAERVAAASWQHVKYVARQDAIYPYPRFLGDGAGISYVDDAYMFQLNAVTLTATPTTKANSTEATGIRVDGLDTMTQPVTALTATAGSIRFAYTPRHAAADAVKFGNSTVYILEAYGDGTNYIRVYWSAANTVTLAIDDGGGVQSDTWNATGAIVAGTTYQIVVAYTATECTLSVGGVVKATVTTSISFVTVPTTVYFGSSQVGVSAADAAFAAPT